jgi:hypothetical protein
MSSKSLPVPALVGALVLFLSGLASAQRPQPQPKQPGTHTLTIHNGNKAMHRTFVRHNDSWRSYRDFKTLAPKFVFPDLDQRVKQVPKSPHDDLIKEINKRMAELQKRMEQLHKRGQMKFQVPGGFPGEELQKRMEQMQKRALRQFRMLGGFPGMEPARAQSAQEARLGAELRQPSATLVNQLDLPREQGMVLAEVAPNSPAATAGLKQHDILLEVDGKPVPSNREKLDRLLEGIEGNKKVDVAVMRRGKKETIKGLTLPEAKEERRPLIPLD